METYEEVMRRNEPKNYTVRWQADGDQKTATYFESFEEAEYFVSTLSSTSVRDVEILRAGRHPSSSRWNTPNKKSVRKTTTGGLIVSEDAWKIPVGYVDGDADKHGPKEYVPIKVVVRPRTDGEKAKWARNLSKQDTGLLGFRAI